MIRPCDQCGGSGVVFDEKVTDGEPKDYPCPRCVDMPRVSWAGFSSYVWGRFAQHNAPDWFTSHQSRKPDPDSVMRWCTIHDSGMSSINEMSCAYWQAGHYDEDEIPSLSGCHIVWIERPIPLMEVSDE